MRSISTKILFFLAPALAIGIFLIDCFFYIIAQFDFNINLSFITISLSGMRALAIASLMLCWFFVIKRRFSLPQFDLGDKLTRFILLLTANYVVVFVLQLIFPAYVNEIHPPPGALASVIYALYLNLIGLVVIATLIPVLLIIRELIFYKQRRTTRLYFDLFLVLIAISTIWVYSTDTPLNFSVLWFDSSANSTVYNTIIVWSLAVITLFLSFRNDWITYLPRKKKFLYFGIGLIALVQIFSLRDYIFVPHLPEYSYIVSNFGYIIWAFLIIYGIVAMITLLVHLPTAKAVDRKLKEVESLYDFARQLNTELNYQKLTQLITQLTARVLESQSTWLELYNSDEKKLILTSHINLTQQQILNNPFDAVTNINQQLVEKKEAVLINDLSQDRQLRYISKWKRDARSFLAAPLFSSRDHLMGIIYATKSQPFGFDIDDLSILEGFATQSAIALENAELWKSSLEKERLAQELKIARDVQLKLLPQKMPEISNIEIDTYFITANEVGGDYFDFIQFTDQNPGLVIGDVSGKGTSAAFYMAEFKGVIQTLANTLNDPKDLVSQANRIFYSAIERQSFVTAIIGKFIPEKRVFQFIRAGHTPILHCSGKNASTRYLQPPGLGIGLERGPLFEKNTQMEKVKLEPGDVLVLFTDGLIEARNKFDEEFGEERLQRIMSDCAGKSAVQIKHRILVETTDFIEDTPLHDDMTFIVIKVE